MQFLFPIMQASLDYCVKYVTVVDVDIVVYDTCRCTNQSLMTIGASSSTTMTVGSSMAVRNWRKPQCKMSTLDFFLFSLLL